MILYPFVSAFTQHGIIAYPHVLFPLFLRTSSVYFVTIFDDPVGVVGLRVKLPIGTSAVQDLKIGNIERVRQKKAN